MSHSDHCECLVSYKQLLPRLEQYARQVHAWASNPIPLDPYELTERIMWYVDEAIPPLIIWKPNSNDCILTAHLSMTHFRNFLCYLATKTIILSAANIQTEFMGLDHKIRYARCSFGWSYVENFPTIETVMSNERATVTGLGGTGRRYEEYISELQTYMNWQIHSKYGYHERYDVDLVLEPHPTARPPPPSQIPDAQGFYPFKMVQESHEPSAGYMQPYYANYHANLRCSTPQTRQARLKAEMHTELLYAPPSPPLPTGGICYQSGLQSFTQGRLN